MLGDLLFFFLEFQNFTKVKKLLSIHKPSLWAGQASFLENIQLCQFSRLLETNRQTARHSSKVFIFKEEHFSNYSTLFKELSFFQTLNFPNPFIFAT